MSNERFENTAKKAEDYASGSKAMGSAQEAFKQAKGYVTDSYESVTNRINDKPVQSTLIALGVGYLLSRFIRL